MGFPSKLGYVQRRRGNGQLWANLETYHTRTGPNDPHNVLTIGNFNPPGQRGSFDWVWYWLHDSVQGLPPGTHFWFDRDLDQIYISDDSIQRDLNLLLQEMGLQRAD